MKNSSVNSIDLFFNYERAFEFWRLKLLKTNLILFNPNRMGIWFKWYEIFSKWFKFWRVFKIQKVAPNLPHPPPNLESRIKFTLRCQHYGTHLFF